MKENIRIQLSTILLFLAIPSMAVASCGRLTEPMTPEAIAKRITPVGKVEAEGGSGAPVALVSEALGPNAGEDRYKSTCAVCHETGVGGAPKFRNAGDWKPRMADGMDTMLAIAIKGKGAMPPKGTCMQCSDQELKMAIEYMLPK
ncbi:c-type cytochrome [Candidatus Berkiella aquae]|uniref:C-type cytochrome n=1 Tax=Candidatus Berkiella aquae TaxID=295108 RepID=A0A0Q9YMQ8_9GAMM|nr:c-type cytochrome [Candidatus Berkiella aquae]MCS5712728.1 c-type cytochrome [Candidatus Berkiella aquae]